MSEKLSSDEINDITGGSEDPNASYHNPGGACRHFVCDFCGATPDDMLFNMAGHCVMCHVTHKSTCPYGMRGEFKPGYNGHCSFCVHQSPAPNDNCQTKL